MKSSKLTRVLASGLFMSALAVAPTLTLAAGVPHLSGGVGLTERAEMQAQAGKYNLRLEFARARDGAYFADVNVRIRNQAGKTVLNLEHTGPLVYARLPAGTYRVEATRDTVRKQQVVQVKKGAPTRVILTWKD